MVKKQPKEQPKGPVKAKPVKNITKTVTLIRDYESLDDAKRDLAAFTTNPEALNGRLPKPGDFNIRFAGLPGAGKVVPSKDRGHMAQSRLELELTVNGTDVDIQTWLDTNAKMNQVNRI